VRNHILRLSLPLCLALLVSAQTGEWKSYKNTDGNFNALFPGEPKDSVNPSAESIRSHTLLAIWNKAAYTVIYAAMATDQTVDEATYETYKNSVLRELPKCNVGKEETAAPAIQGYVGHWYRLNCEGFNAVGNLYWGKRYAYAVMVMFPADTAEPTDSKKFLDSFSVLAPS
jgi:hypothetical protein